MENIREKLENSLNTIEEFFPDIKKSCIKGHFKIETDRLNDMDEIIRCIKLYAILKDLRTLKGRKLEVLSYYLKFGYSKETKKDIIKGINITDSNLNNINHELRKIGVIKNIGYNLLHNEVSKELIKFKEFIVDNRGEFIFVKINEK